MGALSKILRYGQGNRLFFYCPGCKGAHMIQYGEGDGPRWTWNGDAEKPTFRASILVTYEGEDDGKPVKEVCHSFVTDGQIQFLSDCTHALAGQTVPIPDFPY